MCVAYKIKYWTNTGQSEIFAVQPEMIYFDGDIVLLIDPNITSGWIQLSCGIMWNNSSP
jgi:hypothetical protein